jgi:uncharacterized protein YciI
LYGNPRTLMCRHGHIVDKDSIMTDGQPGPDTDEEWTWVALVHQPGPEAPTAGSLFQDPRFGGHTAFLARMMEQGFLVAAGPLGDEPGAGMTVLRLPGADRLADATELATIDDSSVSSGFFTVAVRPWNVVMPGTRVPARSA